jgi:hypothetical protein
MPAPFVGNQDYRGYLNYLGTQGDPVAKQLLGVVGNDAKFGSTIPYNSETTRMLQGRNTELYNAYTSLNKLPSIYGGGGGGAPAPVYAPKLDIAGVYAKARSAAEGAVNPFYTKQLNDFLAQQGAQKQQQQTQYETNIKNLEDQLKNTLEQNDITKGRTTEDVAQNEAQIAQTADEFQTDTGQQFDQSRLAAARGASTGGLGQQQLETGQQARNTQETRQTQQFQQKKQEQELFKTRTFADLARSGTLAGEATTKGKAAAKFDLDSYIQNAGFTEQNKRNELEQNRLQAVGQEQGNQSKLLFNQYLSGISNPAQYQAALQTYGGSF